MASSILQRVGAPTDDLLHHVPLHLVRHSVRRHEVVAGGARNPSASCDVDDAVENAATVTELLASVKDEKKKAQDGFQANLRRRVAARIASERTGGGDSKNVTNIARAVATAPRGSKDNPRARAKTLSSKQHPLSPLEALLASSAATTRESHRRLLVSIVPAAFGGEVGRRDAVKGGEYGRDAVKGGEYGRDAVKGDARDTETNEPTTSLPFDVAESRAQRVANARRAAATAQRRDASRRVLATTENHPAHWRARAAAEEGGCVDDVTTTSTTYPVTHVTETELVEEKAPRKPTSADVAAWLARLGLTFANIPPVCACPHSFDSAPFDERAPFRCARNCFMFGDAHARDEATRAALRALGG